MRSESEIIGPAAYSIEFPSRFRPRFCDMISAIHLRKNLIHEKTPQSGMVWTRRPRRLSLSQLDEESGLAPRPVRRTPGDWNLQHLVRTHALQRAFSRVGGIRKARRLGGRRLSPRVS